MSIASQLHHVFSTTVSVAGQYLGAEAIKQYIAANGLALNFTDFVDRAEFKVFLPSDKSAVVRGSCLGMLGSNC